MVTSGPLTNGLAPAGPPNLANFGHIAGLPEHDQPQKWIAFMKSSVGQESWMNLCKSEHDFWQRQTTPMRKHIKKISGNSLRRACGWKQLRPITAIYKNHLTHLKPTSQNCLGTEVPCLHEGAFSLQKVCQIKYRDEGAWMPGAELRFLCIQRSSIKLLSLPQRLQLGCEHGILLVCL